MLRTDEQNRRVLTARSRWLESRDPDGLPGVRPEVAASWKRSLYHQVDPTGVRPDYRKMTADRLSAAALPVIEHSLESLSGTATSLLFADEAGRLIGRWTDSSTLRQALSRSYVEAGFCMSEEVVGANGIGTALETGQIAEFRGAEHFSEQYLPFTCVGAPIRHPVTRRIIGAIDITCRYEDTTSIARSWITTLAQQIEQQMLDDASVRERMLLSSYLTTSRRSRRPVVCLNDRIVISSSAAAAVLGDLDQQVLWEAARRVCGTAATGTTTITLADGAPVVVRCRAVRDEGRLVGAVVELQVGDDEPPRSGVLAVPRLQLAGRAAATPEPGLSGLAGRSPRWAAVCAEARRVPAGASGVVVAGEAGTGKLAVLRSVFAEAADTVVVDCALEPLDGTSSWVGALRGRMMQPCGPTVLAHLEALTPAAARAVCALLDSQPEGASRVVATTTTGDDAVQAHPPLVERLGVTRITVPPLRERTEDIPALVESLTRRHAGDTLGRRWLPESLTAMTRHRWPGNVRELESVVRRVLASPAAGPIGVGDLPDEIRSHGGSRRVLTQLEQLERQEIIEALKAEGGNKVRAAERLNLARSTLYRKLSAFGIDAG